MPQWPPCLAGICACLDGKLKAQAKATGARRDNNEPSSDLFFELRALEIATDFFSEMNKLGHGGFGPVYKGLMPNGQEVAVKKLSLSSRQGVKEFTNEVRVLLKTQHKNLVRLLGCCVEGPEKMLVTYLIFVLVCILFCGLWLVPIHSIVSQSLPGTGITNITRRIDKNKSQSLTWEKRFHMITDVARGLLYLHEEAPERIIHRDIKASNILLDEHLNPKISDFGLARLFPGEDTHLNTMRISGTFGYMAPEYALHGYLSVKTDVFSFGVLVLEIVAGRKNFDRRLSEEKWELLSYAWTLFEEGQTIELIDPRLDIFNRDEQAMCIQVGLLCCQASITERPDMNAICLMLSSDESFTLPKPVKPGLQGRKGQRSTADNSSALQRSTADNSSTITFSSINDGR